VHDRSEEDRMPLSSGDGGHEPGVDPDLRSLVQLANAFGLEQELVLVLPGLVVSGTLISAKTHFDELAGALQGDDPDGTFRATLAARFRLRGERLAEWGAGSQLGDLDPEEPDEHDLQQMPEPDYVHLRDATVVTWPRSGQVLPLWRGRLHDVVGWTVGGFHETGTGTGARG
jgi:hypothetical protein